MLTLKFIKPILGSMLWSLLGFMTVAKRIGKKILGFRNMQEKLENEFSIFKNFSRSLCIGTLLF